MSFPCIKCWKRNLRFGKGEKYGSSRGPGTIYEKQTFLKDHWQNIREQLKEGSKSKKNKKHRKCDFCLCRISGCYC